MSSSSCWNWSRVAIGPSFVFVSDGIAIWMWERQRWIGFDPYQGCGGWLTTGRSANPMAAKPSLSSRNTTTADVQQSSSQPAAINDAGASTFATCKSVNTNVNTQCRELFFKSLPESIPSVSPLQRSLFSSLSLSIPFCFIESSQTTISLECQSGTNERTNELLSQSVFSLRLADSLFYCFPVGRDPHESANRCCHTINSD